ncbi:50S ribosomal protein L11 methyltransferase [Rhizobium sp. S163]|uniref:class I SAM-dependent methyltransferase n=1 Tax=Rhizobium sp. S163 TaxID=3055039 RepID=UPI0025A9562F|nr:50S ribosomal protein L11 methyltransferase [Rhizobium sp. S163]MDM9644117.1 50S ribosomal protein L11 methyltransferase [Rhizobium sp. S163]
MHDKTERMTSVSTDDGAQPQKRTSSFDASAFIARNLRLLPVPGLANIQLYTAHSGSRLSRLGGTDPDAPAPYWAYGWGGGAVLARYIAENPHLLHGRRVLDLGTGSGLVAIVASKAGATSVVAADIDENAIAAARLNASVNGVEIDLVHTDLLDGPPPAVDIVLAGDLFYDEALAKRALAFLETCRAAGIDVLIGDPYRVPLPTEKLHCIAEYSVPDFGLGREGAEVRAGIFSLATVTDR